MNNSFSSGATPDRGRTARRTFWAVLPLYLLVAFEFVYMCSPFAGYLYGVYGPGLRFLAEHPSLAWLGSVFLPHLVVETRSTVLNLVRPVGVVLFLVGTAGFVANAVQVYALKLLRRGAASGGMYRWVRHPQYASFAAAGLGLLLLWPRVVAVPVYVAMLFAYFLLARAEERECLERFGESYAEYLRRTPMFVPGCRGRIAPQWLVEFGGRGAGKLVLFGVAVAGAVLAAGAVRDWTLGHLYSRFDGTAAWLSIGRVSEAKLGRVAELVRQVPATAAFWRHPGADSAPLVYVLPETWYVPEIPMAVVGDGDHANAPVAENSRYKAIIMATDAPGRPDSAGWLRGVRHRRALMELLVDPVAGTVDRVAPPPAHAPYEGIPVPLF